MKNIPFLQAHILCCAILLCTTGVMNAAMAEDAIKKAAPVPAVSSAGAMNLPEEVMNFFSGEWQGEGEFASGKKIAADVSFIPDLDKQWLQYRHTDRAPNTFKSLALWGYDRELKSIVMIGSNNFGSARLFHSEGWKDDTLIFSKVVTPVNKQDGKPINAMAERFHFIRLNENSFKMIYENQRDGVNWRMVDYLIFSRKPAAN